MLSALNASEDILRRLLQHSGQYLLPALMRQKIFFNARNGICSVGARGHDLAKLLGTDVPAANTPSTDVLPSSCHNIALLCVHFQPVLEKLPYSAEFRPRNTPSTCSVLQSHPSR